MLAPIARLFSRPTKQSNSGGGSSQTAKTRLCPEHPTPDGNRGTQHNREKRDQSCAGCSSDNYHKPGKNNYKGDCGERHVRELGQPRGGNCQTGERSEKKSRCSRSHPLQSAKEQRTEANRRQHIVVHG